LILRTVLAAAVVLGTLPAAVPSVASAEAKMRTVCEGFRNLSGTPTYLRQIDFYEGALSDNATLAPDASDETDGKLVNRWTFSPEQRITLVCGYGAAKQVRGLPKTVTACTATFVAVADSRRWKAVNVSCG
jgi:hypothetical protein